MERMIWWLMACAGGVTSPEPALPEASAVLGEPSDGEAPEAASAPALPGVDELLLVAAEKGNVGDRDAAVAAWRGAHAGFQATVEPSARKACGDCATALEYEFGLLRAELDRPGSKPIPRAKALIAALEPYLPARPPLPEAPPAPPLPPEAAAAEDADDAP
jgi:hypothetical protein